MTHTPEDHRNAALIKRTAMAMLDAMSRCGAVENVTVCFASTGSLMGALAVSADNPEEAMTVMTAVARGIIDGSLRD